MKNEKEFARALAGKVDEYQTAEPPASVDRETVYTPMSADQAALYRGMYDKIPLLLRQRMQQEYPLSPKELQKLTGFLTGPRQVSLSTLPFMKSSAICPPNTCRSSRSRGHR